MRSIQADARSIPLPDSSVDLALWSPPYFAMRIYGDSPDEIGRPQSVHTYIEELMDAVRESFRVLKPGASLFVNLQDRVVNRSRVRRSAHQPGLHGGGIEKGRTWAETAAAGEVITSQIAGVPERSLALVPERFAVAAADRGYYVKSNIIWAKPFGTPDPEARDRVVIRHEHVYQLSTSPAVDIGDEAQLTSVWTINPSNARSGHPAPWPEELASKIIAKWSKPGDTVLDAFGGSGTTARAAEALGRNAISVDLYEWEAA